jgi:hypothetical protein
MAARMTHRRVITVATLSTRTEIVRKDVGLFMVYISFALDRCIYIHLVATI